MNNNQPKDEQAELKVFTLDARIDATLDLFAKVFPEKVDGTQHAIHPNDETPTGYGLRQLIHDEITRALGARTTPSVGYGTCPRCEAPKTYREGCDTCGLWDDTRIPPATSKSVDELAREAVVEDKTKTAMEYLNTDDGLSLKEFAGGDEVQNHSGDAAKGTVAPSTAIPQDSSESAGDPTRFLNRSFTWLENKGQNVRLLDRDDPQKGISVVWDDLPALRELITLALEDGPMVIGAQPLPAEFLCIDPQGAMTEEHLALCDRCQESVRAALNERDSLVKQWAEEKRLRSELKIIAQSGFSDMNSLAEGFIREKNIYKDEADELRQRLARYEEQEIKK